MERGVVTSVHLVARRITPVAPSADAQEFTRRWTAEQLRERAATAHDWLDRAAGSALAHRIETSKGEIQ